MKCRESSETRFGKVWRDSEPCSRGKRQFKNAAGLNCSAKYLRKRGSHCPQGPFLIKHRTVCRNTVTRWLSEIKSSVECKSEGKVRSEVDLGSIRGRFGIDSASIRDRFGVDSGSIRGRFGVNSGSIRGRFGVDSVSNGRSAEWPQISNSY